MEDEWCHCGGSDASDLEEGRAERAQAGLEVAGHGRHPLVHSHLTVPVHVQLRHHVFHPRDLREARLTGQATPRRGEPVGCAWLVGFV